MTSGVYARHGIVRMGYSCHIVSYRLGEKSLHLQYKCMYRSRCGRFVAVQMDNDSYTTKEKAHAPFNRASTRLDSAQRSMVVVVPCLMNPVKSANFRSTNSLGRLVQGFLFKTNSAIGFIVSNASRQSITVYYKYTHTLSSSRHTLTTPLVLHADRHRRLRELLLCLGLAVRLVLLAHRMAAGIL